MSDGPPPSNGPPSGGPPGVPMGLLPPDTSRGVTLNVIIWIGAAISTIFVLLRIYSRKFVTHALDWSDALIVVAQMFNIVCIALGSVSVSYGIGRHLVYIPLEDVENVLFYGTIVQPFGIVAYCLPKLSVVLLIVSLMGPEKKCAWFLWMTIPVLFITNALSAVMLFAQCNPPDHLWHPFEPAKCLPDHVLINITYVGGAWSAFTDLVLAVFPAILLRNLQLKKSKKIKIIIIMGLGFFAMIAAIIKTTQLGKNHSPDATYELFWLCLTTYLEIVLVIVAACAPMLPKLIDKFLGKKTQSSGAGSFGSHTGNRGYRAFDSENSRSLALDSIYRKVTIAQQSRAVNDSGRRSAV